MSDMNQEVQEETFEFMDNHGTKYDVPKVIKYGDSEIPIQVLIGSAISKSRKETQSKVESKYADVIKEMNAIKGEYEDTKSKLEEIENKNNPETNTEVIKLRKDLERFQKEKEVKEKEAQNNLEKYKKERINGEFHKGLTGYDLYNYDQATKIFMNDVDIEYLEEDGSSKIKVRANLPTDSGDFQEIEGNVKEVFGKWIGLPSNSYLLKNTLNPGGGTTKTGATRTGNGSLVYKRSQLSSNPEVRKEYNAKRKEGLDVSIIDG